jgi:hypothetical protein
MKLLEMFSPIGAPRADNNEIDWIDDLKFFIDNDNQVLSQYLFPAVKKHSKDLDNPKAYRLYFKPITTALESYCAKYEIKDRKEKFTNEALVELAKKICEEQKRFIESGDYETK